MSYTGYRPIIINSVYLSFNYRSGNLIINPLLREYGCIQCVFPLYRVISEVVCTLKRVYYTKYIL